MNPHAINVACGSNAVTHHGRHPPCWGTGLRAGPVPSLAPGIRTRNISLLKRAPLPLDQRKFGTDGGIRTLTGGVLSAVSLPLEYVSMVLV